MCAWTDCDETSKCYHRRKLGINWIITLGLPFKNNYTTIDLIGHQYLWNSVFTWENISLSLDIQIGIVPTSVLSCGWGRGRGEVLWNHTYGVSRTVNLWKLMMGVNLKSERIERRIPAHLPAVLTSCVHLSLRAGSRKLERPRTPRWAGTLNS